MTPNIVLLEARIRKELFQLEKLDEELRSYIRLKEPRAESFRSRVYASILHDFYSGIEKIFINIAREIDQFVPVSEGWHRQLLEQMTLDIPSKRPAVINNEMAAQIQQYLSFRHRFRNLYGYELELDKMEGLIKNMGTCLKRLKKQMEGFLDIISGIVD